MSDSYFYVKNTAKQHYLALDMANGMTYVGREEVRVITKGTPFAIDNGKTSNLVDAIIVPTKSCTDNKGPANLAKEYAKEYISLYQAGLKSKDQCEKAQPVCIGDIGSHQHIIRIWDLGYDITDKL